MPSRAHRSRSLRQVKRRVPGGRVVIHYKRRKPSRALCSYCGIKLQGVPAVRPVDLKSIPKSQRRPNRKYGGSLCSRCLRQKLIKEVRTHV